MSTELKRGFRPQGVISRMSRDFWRNDDFSQASARNLFERPQSFKAASEANKEGIRLGRCPLCERDVIGEPHPAGRTSRLGPYRVIRYCRHFLGYYGGSIEQAMRESLEGISYASSALFVLATPTGGDGTVMTAFSNRLTGYREYEPVNALSPSRSYSGGSGGIGQFGGTSGGSGGEPGGSFERFKGWVTLWSHLGPQIEGLVLLSLIHI